MSHSSENKKLEDILRSKFESAELEGDTPSFDRVMNGFEKSKKERASLNNLRLWLSVAASLILVIGASWFFMKSSPAAVAVKPVDSDKADQQTLVTKDISEPGPITPPIVSKGTEGKKDVHVPQKVEQIRFTSADRNFRYLLPDSSVVFLDKGSEMVYSADFGAENRQVSFSGTGYFEVQKSEIPFIITTERTTTTVKGTAFNLRSDSRGEEILVTSGKVEYAISSTERLVLVKGDAASLEDGQLVKNTNPDPNVLAWHSGVLQYKSTPVQNILSDLKAFYGKSITVQDSSMLNCTFSGTFRNLEVSMAMNILAVSLKAGWKEEDGKLILTGNGCE